MGKRLDPIEAAVREGKKEQRRHVSYREDEDGWIVCKCKQFIAPTPEDWGDHYAEAVLYAAVRAVELRFGPVDLGDRSTSSGV